MARYASAARGRFGRLPRASPDLSNTLQSIARQMIDKEDSDMVSAWKSGGLYDGKQVTDQAILQLWSDRMKGMSDQDPLYWQYSELHDQYDFSISESKVKLAYDQGKMTDGQVAKFYTDWAKKVNPNTEFYRTLMDQAASFLKAVRTRASSNAANARAKLYADTVTGYFNSSDFQTGNLMMSAITKLAQAFAGVSTKATASGTDIETGADASIMQSVFDQLKHGTTTDPALQNWWNQFAGMLSKADPSFGKMMGTHIAIINGNPRVVPNSFSGFDINYVEGVLERYNNKLQQAIDYMRATGHKSDADALQKQQTLVQKQATQTGLWHDAQAYNAIKNSLTAVLDDPSASALEKAQARNRAAAALKGLAGRGEMDLRTAELLQNEAKALLGDPTANLNESTWGESFSGQTQGGETSTVQGAQVNKSQTLAQEAEGATALAQQISDVQSGKAVWAQGHYDGSGHWVWGGATNALSATDLPTDGSYVTVMLPGVNGQSVPTAVQVVHPTVDITQAGTGARLTYTTGATTNARGQTVPGGPLGSTPQDQGAPGIITITEGSTQIHIYQLADGSYSVVPPWDPNVVRLQSDGQGHLTLVGSVQGTGEKGNEVNPRNYVTGVSATGVSSVPSTASIGVATALAANLAAPGTIQPNDPGLAATVRDEAGATGRQYLASHPGDYAGAVAAENAYQQQASQDWQQQGGGQSLVPTLDTSDRASRLADVGLFQSPSGPRPTMTSAEAAYALNPAQAAQVARNAMMPDIALPTTLKVPMVAGGRFRQPVLPGPQPSYAPSLGASWTPAVPDATQPFSYNRPTSAPGVGPYGQGSSVVPDLHDSRPPTAPTPAPSPAPSPAPTPTAPTPAAPTLPSIDAPNIVPRGRPVAF